VRVPIPIGLRPKSEAEALSSHLAQAASAEASAPDAAAMGDADGAADSAMRAGDGSDSEAGIVALQAALRASRNRIRIRGPAGQVLDVASEVHGMAIVGATDTLQDAQLRAAARVGDATLPGLAATQAATAKQRRAAKAAAAGSGIAPSAVATSASAHSGVGAAVPRTPSPTPKPRKGTSSSVSKASAAAYSRAAADRWTGDADLDGERLSVCRYSSTAAHVTWLATILHSFLHCSCGGRAGGGGGGT